MRAGWRVTRWFGLASLVFFALVVLVVGGSMAWLASHYSPQHPLDITSYWPRIESVLAERGLNVTVGKIEAFYDGSPVIRASEVGVMGRDGRLDVYVENIAVKLANRRLFALLLSPKVIEAEGVTLRLVRRENTVNIAGFEMDARAAQSMQTDTKGLIEWLNNLDSDGLWGRLKSVKMGRLTVLLRDDVQQAEWALEDGNLLFSRYVGEGEHATLNAQIRRLYGGKELGIMPVLVSFEHTPQATEAVVTARLEQADVALVADYFPPQLHELLRAKGGLEVGTNLLTENRLGQPWVTLHLGQVTVQPPKGFSAPIVLPKVMLTASYTPSPTDVLDVKNLLIQTAKGNPLRVVGRVVSLTTDPLIEAQFESYGGDVQGLVDFLPDQPRGTGRALVWLRENLKNVEYTNLRGKVALKPSSFPDCGDACGVIEVDAEVKPGGNVRYLPELVPVVADSATVSWRGQVLEVKTVSGSTVNQRVRDVRVRLTEMLSALPTLVMVSATLEGPTREVMGELRKLDDSGKIPTELSGQHTTELSVVVPMPHGVEPTFAMSTVQVSSSLRDVMLKGVKELDGDVLTAKQVRVQLLADKTLKVSSPAALLEKNQIQMDWQQNLMPGQPDDMKLNVDGVFASDWLMAKAKQKDNLTMQGPVKMKANLEEKRPGEWVYMLNADLRAAKVNAQKLNYTKKSGEALVVQAAGVYGPGDALSVERLLANGAGVKVMGELAYNPAKVDDMVVKFSPFMMGQSDVVIDYAARKAVVKGRRLDLRGMDLFADDDGKKDGVKNLELALDVQNVTTRNGVVTGLKGNLLARNGVWDIQQLTALVDGVARVNIQMTPLPGQKGRRKLSLNVDDVGRALRAMGLYDSLKGGKLWGEITYDSPDVGGGLLKMEKFELRNPPTMVKLLGLLSLQQLLAGSDGTLFDKGTFPVRLDGKNLFLDNASLEGPSMSLRLTGYYARDREEVNFDGKLAPALPFNRLVSKVPLLGTLLTGSQDGVVVADFKLKGPADDAEVSVRPLSLLTPGLVKDVFSGISTQSGPTPPKPKVKSNK